MTISIKDLVDEKKQLDKDFNETKSKIEIMTVDLGQLKANLNALSGAIQQTNKLITMAQKLASGETKKEGKK
tara:strand:+ start:209 stop:424 length:216 start_codon:yes stop_codon:yes gene_type:complete